MPQHDMILANQAGAAFRTDLNDALAALVANSSGATAPTTMYAYQLWADTTTGRLMIRNAANSAWIVIGQLGSIGLGRWGGPNVDVASAATLNLTTAIGSVIRITGTTATSNVTLNNGQMAMCVAAGNWPLTHHSTNHPLPAGLNYTCAANDLVIYYQDNSGVKHVRIIPASVHPGTVSQVVAETGTDTTPRMWTAERIRQAIEALTPSSGITLGTPVASTSGVSIDFTSIPAGTKRVIVDFAAVSTNSTSPLMVQIGDAGGIENTGYQAGVTNDNGTRITSTSGFPIVSIATAGDAVSGRVVLTLLNASTNKWVSAGQICETSSGMDGESAGHKTLSAALDRVRITTVGGSATFDAGEINISYES